MQNELDKKLLVSLFEETEAADNESDFPLLDAPAGLEERLYQISRKNPRKKVFLAMPVLGSIAAVLLLVAALTMHFAMEHQRREQQVLQVTQELKMTLHYMAQANSRVMSRIDRPLVGASLMQVLKPLKPTRNEK